jgi:hypothetical protein
MDEVMRAALIIFVVFLPLLFMILSLIEDNQKLKTILTVLLIGVLALTLI